jgi:hypothetical protein
MRLVFLLAILLAPTPAASSSPAAQASPPAISPDALFSRRALRRAKLLIQMRLMEFREEQLECIREALAHRLPVALWPQLPLQAIEHCRDR